MAYRVGSMPVTKKTPSVKAPVQRGIDQMPRSPQRGIDQMPRQGPNTKSPAGDWRFGFANKQPAARATVRGGLNPRPAPTPRRRSGPADGDGTFDPRNAPPSRRRRLPPGSNPKPPLRGRLPVQPSRQRQRRAWQVRTQARVDKYGWKGYQNKFGDDARQKRPAWLKKSPLNKRARSPRNGIA